MNMMISGGMEWLREPHILLTEQIEFPAEPCIYSKSVIIMQNPF